MLTTLVESSPRRSRSVGQALLSLGFHVGLGVGAIEATRRTLLPEPPRVISAVSYYVAPERKVPAEPVATSSAPLSPLPVSADPIIVSPPMEVPAGLPSIPSGQAIEARRFVVGPTEWARCLSRCPSADSSSAPVFREEVVDEPARVLSQRAPTYPPVLKAAGIVGRVVVEFVVDRSGTVEGGSVKVVELSHAGFERSAREAVLGTRFSPAKIHGTPVRQLVRQGVSYRIGS